MEEPLVIKGTRDGLRLVVDHDAPWESVVAALRQRFANGDQFFQGARLIVDIGERQLSDEEMAELLALMAEHGLRPETLATASPKSRGAARRAGVITRPTAVVAPPPSEGDEALLVRRTVRSGQQLRVPGHLIVLGDVNAGSELIAGGSIIVWGRLRGSAHAGALGDREAAICALDLQPSLLRIADVLARAPDRNQSLGPEQARLDGQQIIVVPWDGSRR